MDAEEREDAIEELLSRLEGWDKAYPLDIFSEPTAEEREWLHEAKRGLMDRIAASMGRHMAACIREDLQKLRALQAQPAEGGVPTEEQVEAAAKRMYSAWYGGEPPASFEVMDGYVPAKGYADRFRRMARAAIAAPKPATTTGEGVGS